MKHTWWVGAHEAHVEVHKAHVEVHWTLGTYRTSRESSHLRVQRLSKHQYIRLVLLDLLSVAVLIHHAEVTQGRQVVRAASLDKLCPQASLASLPMGGPDAAKSLPRHLATSVALLVAF